MPTTRWCSGIFTASRAIRSAPPSPRWGRCCWRGCSGSTRRRKACSTSPSATPTTRACCCSTSRTCRRCWSIPPRTPSELTAKYGNVAKATVGTIQRQLLALDSQGGAMFFGEPALEIADFIRTDEQGRGVHQRARRRPADAQPQALRHLPAVAARRAVRGAARGRRSREAQAGVLLRRSAPAVRRCARRRCRRRSSRSSG